MSRLHPYPPDFYVTPILADEAAAHDIRTINGDPDPMKGVLNLITGLAKPPAAPPAVWPKSVEKFVYILRYGDRDTTFHSRDDTDYIPAKVLGAPTDPRQHGATRGWVSRTDIHALRKPVIELTVGSWKRPDFGRALALGYFTTMTALYRSHERIRQPVNVQLDSLGNLAQLKYPHPFKVSSRRS